MRVLAKVNLRPSIPEYFRDDSLHSPELNVLILFLYAKYHISETDVLEDLPDKCDHLDYQVSPAVSLSVEKRVMDQLEKHGQH